jgi:hypothetical protein
VVAGRVEQVPPMRWIDVKEDARNDNSLLFKEFFKERLCSLSAAGGGR